MEYEGFKNYSTWLAATMCDNNKELYKVVHDGLDVVVRRFKCGDPNKSSYPFMTTGRGAAERIPRLKGYVLHSKGIDVMGDMTATLHSTFVRNDVLPAIQKDCQDPDGDYPDFDCLQVCNEQLCDHILAMYFDKVYQEVHYARERK